MYVRSNLISLALIIFCCKNMTDNWGLLTIGRELDSATLLSNHVGSTWCQQREMAAPISWMFWRHFCTMGGGGRVPSIFWYRRYRPVHLTPPPNTPLQTGLLNLVSHLVCLHFQFVPFYFFIARLCLCFYCFVRCPCVSGRAPINKCAHLDIPIYCNMFVPSDSPQVEQDNNPLHQDLIC